MGHHGYPIYYRRFGLFRRFWWFALGAGAATLWARRRDEQAQNGTSQRRCGSWRSHREIPHTQQDGQQPPAYAYDWASHRPGLNTGMPAEPPAPVTPVESEPTSAPTAPPAPAPTPAPRPLYTDEELARFRERKDELEARAREFAVDKLERLSVALGHLRESLMTSETERRAVPPQQQQQDKRWV